METRQEYWGSLAAGCFLLVALGAMMFTVLAVLDFSGADIAAQLNGPAGLTAFAAAGLGSLMLMIELGNKTKAYLVISNPASIATKNAVMMSAFMACAFIYATFFFDLAPWKGMTVLKNIIAVLGVITGLAAVVIPALELGESRGRGFWNAAGLVPLFLISGAASGLASVAAIAAFMGLEMNPAVLAIDKTLPGFLILLFVILTGYVMGMMNSGAPEARKSAQILFRGELQNAFWGVCIVLGIIAPLFLYLFASTAPVMIGRCVLILIGAAGFRSLFLKAGIRRPLPGEENEYLSHEELEGLAGVLEKSWKEKSAGLANKF